MLSILNRVTTMIAENIGIFSTLFGVCLIILTKMVNRKREKAKQKNINKETQLLIAKKNSEIAMGASRIVRAFEKYPPELVEELKRADIKALQSILRDPERSVTSKDLVIIFGSLCYKQGSKYGWLADQMFEEALALAEKRDEERIAALQEGRELSMLHGIPFSIKDHIRYKGSSSTWGHPSKFYPLDSQTCITVQMLMIDGAIPLVKSALPVIPGLSTYNVYTGHAKNPYNPERSSGGTSGGEGGLVGSGCSPFGIGSDIAGSIRVPAGNCGASALLPSLKRVARGASLGLLLESFKEPECLAHAALGPIAKTPDDIEIIMQSLCKKQSFDSHLTQAPLPFTSQKVNECQNKSYRIGYYTTDGFIRPCGAIERAVLRAKQKLEQEGHTLVLLDKVNNSKLAPLLGEILCVDQLKTMVRRMDLPETKAIGVDNLMQYSKMSPSVVRFIQFLLKKEPRVEILAEKSGEEIKDMEIRLEGEVSKLYSLLQEAEVDAVLCPLFAFPATKAQYFPFGIPINYSAVFNMCGFASGALPFGFVSEQDAKQEYTGDGIEDAFTKGIRKTMQNSAGLPLAIQVASFPGRDELVVALMKQLQEKRHELPKLK